MFGHKRIQKLFYSYIPFERIISQFKMKNKAFRVEKKTDIAIRVSNKSVKC